MKKHGYIAGALFNEGEIAQRISEGKALREKMPEVDWYNPIEAPVNDKSKLPSAKDIFSLDTDYVLKSDYMLADLSREDLGVSMELGIALGVEIARKVIETALKQEVENMGFLTCDESKHCCENDCNCSKVKIDLTDDEIEKRKEIIGNVKENILKNISKMGIKERKIVAHNSDIRIATAGEYNDIHIPYGYNQYVIGGLESFDISIEKNSSDAIEKLKDM